MFLRARGIVLQRMTAGGALDSAEQEVAEPQLAATVAALERQHPRWVWDDTSRWYPSLLAARVRVERCVDLRLSHAVLRNSSLTAGSALAASPACSWDRGALERLERPADYTLFDFDEGPTDDAGEDTIAEFAS